MPILKEIQLPSGHNANYWRITRVDWQELLESAELVENPAYDSENPEPETIVNPAYVDEETTPEESETIANPAYVTPQIWSPVYQAQTVVTLGAFKTRDDYYMSHKPVTTTKVTLKGEENPFRHVNLGKTYAELYMEAYAEIIQLPNFSDGEIIA